MAAFERATVGLVLWWSANNAFAANAGGAVAVSRADVAETAERIEADARSRGLAVVRRTDHSGEARRDGFSIRPIQSLVIDDGSGSPTRFLVWQAPGGATVVSVDERLADVAFPPGFRSGLAAEAAQSN